MKIGPRAERVVVEASQLVKEGHLSCLRSFRGGGLVIFHQIMKRFARGVVACGLVGNMPGESRRVVAHVG
jgi:hypothetical protein